MISSYIQVLPEQNLISQTILLVGPTMLLKLPLCQLGLRPVDVGGEGYCFSEQFLISYMALPITTYSLDKLVFNTSAINLNVLVKAILTIHGMNMSGFLKTVWKNLTSALSGRFSFARNYLQSRRYKN